jgi:hypothetical protein
MTRRQYTYAYPFPPAEVVEFFRLYYGPTNRAFAVLYAAGQGRLRQDLEALWAPQDRAGAGYTTVFAEYLELIGIRA